MIRTQPIVAVVMVVVAAVVACHRTGLKTATSTVGPTVYANIDTTCAVTIKPQLYTGAAVKLSYAGNCPSVNVDFGGTALFGVAQKQVNKGETVDLKVLAPKGAEFVWTLTCSCQNGGHTTPDVKVGDPPPSGNP